MHADMLDMSNLKFKERKEERKEEGKKEERKKERFFIPHSKIFVLNIFKHSLLLFARM